MCLKSRKEFEFHEIRCADCTHENILADSMCCGITFSTINVKEAEIKTHYEKWIIEPCFWGFSKTCCKSI